MNHPKREEWAPYLFGELKSDARRELKAHLETCPECRDEIAAWQRSIRRLDAWKLPRLAKRTEIFAPALKWAVAAAIVLAAGVSLGRLSAPGANAEKMRATIEPQIRQQLRQDFGQLLRDELAKTASATRAAAGEQAKGLMANYASMLEIRRAEDRQAIYAVLDKLESQRVADFVALKKDVDTVAVATDASLRDTERQLVQLADYRQPSPNSNSAPK